MFYFAEEISSVSMAFALTVTSVHPLLCAHFCAPTTQITRQGSIQICRALKYNTVIIMYIEQ